MIHINRLTIKDISLSFHLSHSNLKKKGNVFICLTYNKLRWRTSLILGDCHFLFIYYKDEQHNFWFSFLSFPNLHLIVDSKRWKTVHLSMIPHVLPRFRACLHQPSWLNLRVVDRKPVKSGVENADQPEAIMFTEVVCVRSVLPSCCWLVFQAGPVSMENFQPAQPRSRIHNTDNPNKLLLLWTKQLCGCITRFVTSLWDPLHAYHITLSNLAFTEDMKTEFSFHFSRARSPKFLTQEK